MRAKQMRSVTLAVGLIGLGAVPGLAQEPATSIDQLRVLVRPGDTVIVTDTGGHVLKGSIAGLSLAAVRLKSGGQERDVMESEIRTIRQRKDDSLANGARNGFAVGATIGFLVGLSGAEYFGGAFIPVMVGVYGGIGAGIGTGVDAMITKNQTIYDSAWQRPKTVSVKLVSW